MSEMKLGDILIADGLITQEHFNKALVIQKVNPSLPIGQILCQLGYLARHDLNATLDYYKKRIRLGEILIKEKLINQRMLDHALTVSQKEKIPLGKALINLHYIQEEQLCRAVATQHDLPFASLQGRNFGSELGRFLNASYAIKHRMVVIGVQGTTITLAMVFPLNPITLRELETLTQMKIEPVVARESDIAFAQEQIYGVRHKAEMSNVSTEDFQLDIGEDLTQDVVRSKYVLDYNVEYSLKKILTFGVRTKSSDIHLEITENGMQTRFRIDGILQFLDLGDEGPKIASHGPPLVNKIKILCDLDIAERRRPQDGSFRVKISSAGVTRNVDFRVSVLPTRYGEDIVIRVLDKIGPMTLETVGFRDDYVTELDKMLERPTGIFLVAGPTGSGKTSTLYALLGRINRPGTKILTVEDPIEYSVEGIRQSEVNPAIGNTFAEYLRAFMRQDPDHIIVGEIRDLETAAIAVRASLTGHTVLSTLHTNDATGVVTRLIDMGVEPSLVASTLRCAIAQRLVRVNCAFCSEPYQPGEEVMKLFALLGYPQMTFIHGKGCPECHFSGYSGRKPIIELWAPSREESLDINRSLSNSELRRIVCHCTERQTMFEYGLERVRGGETTIEELLRVVPFEQIDERICRAAAHEVP